MSAETKKEIQLEIAHVLFIDIVGYSKFSINEQGAVVDELTKVVRSSDQYQKAEAASRLIKIPTGDGVGLVFQTSPEAPAQCAVEISHVLKEHPRLQLRMGVHSGPVSGVIDVNERANLAGAGLNIAKRMMDCGDAGHILLSKHVAEDLEEYEHWRPLLHSLGECEVKHGVRVGVVNLYADEIGNPQLPKKFQALKKHSARMRWSAVATALVALGLIVAGTAMFSRYRANSAAPEKSIAVLPFENLSEDKANAYFADGVQDEIRTDLAKIADLKVISRTSVMQYKTTATRNLPEIAQALKVAHVLEGSVQRSANRVRVSAQLSMPAMTRMSGPKNMTATWRMSSPSRARLRRQSRTSSKLNYRQRRKRPSRSGQPKIWPPTISTCEQKNSSTKSTLTPLAKKRMLLKRCSFLTKR
jgi:TolB-like protein